jgi:hypothetical protein
MLITDEHIDGAFDQVETISSLHHGKDAIEQYDAVRAYQEYLGLTQEAADHMIKRVREFVPDELEPVATGWVIMGILVGLSSALKCIESE